MKKAVCLLAAALFCLSLLPVRTGAAGGMSNFKRTAAYKPFSDVPENSWYRDNVAAVCEFGLMNGMDADTFDPDGLLIVAEAITIAARVHAAYYGKTIPSLPTAAHWYDMYVRYAVGEGIADYELPEKGQHADYYAAQMGRQAARSLFASLISNALPDEALKAVNRVEDGGILDLAAASAYTPAVYRLYRAGILTGSTGDGRVFLPEDNIKRSEIAAMVSRVADPSLRRSITVTKWKDTGTVRLNAAGRAFEEQYRDVPEDFAECISILTEGRISTEIMEQTMGKIITEPFPGEDAGRPLNDWFTCLENGDDGCILVSPNQSRTYAYGCLHAPVQLVYVRCGGKQYVLFASDADFTAKVFRLNRDGTVTPGKTLLYGQTSEDGETRTWFDLSDVSLYREYLN